MTITNDNLIRWSGLAAILAGLLYIATQLTHPANEAAQITTDIWATAHYFSFSFAVFGLLGITGIYARQAKEAGWLGLIGYLMFFLGLLLIANFNFFEAFILPLLADEAPLFIAQNFAIFEDESSFELLSALFSINGLLYILGGTLFGIATVRAGVLPRIAAIVFTIGAVAALTGAISEDIGRITTIILSLGLVWLGYALLTEKRS